MSDDGNDHVLPSGRGPKGLATLTAITVLGLAHWFFGNLYEAVVLTPNLLAGKVVALHAWRDFFRFSNPIYYFLPWNPLTVAAAIAAAYLGRRSPEHRWLLGAASGGVVALATTLALVYRVNRVAFFGPITADAEYLVRDGWWIGFSLSTARLVGEAVGLTCAVRAWTAGLRSR